MRTGPRSSTDVLATVRRSAGLRGPLPSYGATAHGTFVECFPRGYRAQVGERCPGCGQRRVR